MITTLALLKMGCSISFPSGYILTGDPKNGYIDTAYSIDGTDKHPDGLRPLDEDGVRLALDDAKKFSEDNGHKWEVGVDEFSSDPNGAIYERMGQFLSSDEEHYPKIVEALKKALTTNPDQFLDQVLYDKDDTGDEEDFEFIEVWEKVQHTMSVQEFCDSVGITNE